MHIIFKLRIGFMIVKRETWLNNTQRYRAHNIIGFFRGVIWGLGFRVNFGRTFWDVGCAVSGLGFGVLGCRILGLVLGLG